MIAGVVLLLVALVTPWWSMSLSLSSADTWTGYLMPGTAASSCSGDCGALYSTCAGDYCFGASSSSGEEWNNGLSNTNGLYEGVLVLLVLSLLAGFVGVFLSLRSAANPSPPRRLMSIALMAAVITVLLTLIALAAATLGQPGTLSADFSNNAKFQIWFSGAGASPTNAFWGSNSESCPFLSPSGCTVTYSWGASVGWYAAWVGVLVLLLAALLLFVDRRSIRIEASRLPSPEPTTALPPPPAGTSAPVSVPAGAGFEFPPPPPPPLP